MKSRGGSVFPALGITLLVLGAVTASRAAAQDLASAPTLFLKSEASAPERLEIDPNPGVCFFSMYFVGGNSGMKFRYAYFGDGRVQMDWYMNQSAMTPGKTWMSQLDQTEAATILAELVGARLHEFDPAEAESREASSGIRRSLRVDSGSVLVEISLVRRRAGQQGAAEVVSNRFAISGSVLRPREGPDLVEYEALRHLAQLGQEIRSRATEQEATQP